MNKLLFTVSVLILVILFPAAALAGNKTISECGTVITKAGNYKLAHDLLACPGAPFGTVGGPLVILSSDVKLNLKGHTIECQTFDNDFAYGYGVYVTEGNSNVHIKNGTITGCNAGILFEGTGESSVSNVTVFNSKVERIPEWGFEFGGHGIWLLFSSDIVVKHSTLLNNEISGVFDDAGAGNKLAHNEANYNGAQGIFANFTEDNKIVCNKASSNGLIGILLGGETSTNNLVKGNLTTGNVGGITLFAATTDALPFDNTIRKNWSYGNAFDLTENLFIDNVPSVEPGAPCRNNWKNNQFWTELGPVGCIGVPVQLDEDDICALDDDDDEDDD